MSDEKIPSDGEYKIAISSLLFLTGDKFGSELVDKIRHIAVMAGDDKARKIELIDTVDQIFSEVLHQEIELASSTLEILLDEVADDEKLARAALQTGLDQFISFADANTYGHILPRPEMLRAGRQQIFLSSWEDCLSSMIRAVNKYPDLREDFAEGLLNVIPQLSQNDHGEALRKTAMVYFQSTGDKTEWSAFFGKMLSSVASINLHAAEDLFTEFYTLEWDDGSINPSLAAIPHMATKHPDIAKQLLSSLVIDSGCGHLINTDKPLLCRHFARADRLPGADHATWLIPAFREDGAVDMAFVNGNRSGLVRSIVRVMQDDHGSISQEEAEHMAKLKEHSILLRQVFAGAIAPDQAAKFLKSFDGTDYTAFDFVTEPSPGLY